MGSFFTIIHTTIRLLISVLFYFDNPYARMTDNKISKRGTVWPSGAAFKQSQPAPTSRHSEGSWWVTNSLSLALNHRFSIHWTLKHKSNMGNCLILSRGVKTLKKHSVLWKHHIPTMNSATVLASSNSSQEGATDVQSWVGNMSS